jgi:hypothetical protein
MRLGFGLRMGQGRGAGYTPANDSNALLVYEADSPQNTTVSGAFSQLTDLSGHGRHATQATAASRPTLTSGMAVFDGVNDTMGITSVAGSGAATWAAYFVIKNGVANSTFKALFDLFYLGFGRVLLEAGTDTAGRIGGQNNGIGFDAGASALATAAPQTLCFEFDGSNFKLYRDGVQVGSTTAMGTYPIFRSGDPAALGSLYSQNNFFYSGGISTVVFMSGSRASHNGARVDSYCAGRKAAIDDQSQGYLNQVMLAGQSLAVGSGSATPVSTSQPYSNVMFNGGVIAVGGGDMASLTALVEGDLDRANGVSLVETPASGFANSTTANAITRGLTHDMLLSSHGIGGAAYNSIKKDSAEWPNALLQARRGHELAIAARKGSRVRAIAVIHGETDDLNRSATYQADVTQWQADYQADIAITRGESPAPVLPMLISQIASFAALGNTTSVVNQAMWNASKAASDRLFLVGPRYMIPHEPDGVHLLAAKYRWLGETYSKVYRKVVLDGVNWKPLQPLTAVRVGNVITVTFDVPVAPLVFDTVRVTEPRLDASAPAIVGPYGFEFDDASGSPPTISSVSLAGPTSATVTLSGTPSGPTPTLRYAHTGRLNAYGGPTTGPRGCLRDSDTTASLWGNELFNWCVHFTMPVTT